MQTMKKHLCLLLTLMILLCGSCASHTLTPTDLLYSALGSLEDHPDGNIFFSGAEENSPEYTDDEKIALLYDGRGTEGLYQSYALFLSSDDSIYELHVYRALSEAKALQIEKILYRRVDMLQKGDIYLYNEDNYEKVISRACVIKKGVYVILLLTDDNDGAKKAMNLTG